MRTYKAAQAAGHPDDEQKLARLRGFAAHKIIFVT